MKPVVAFLVLVSAAAPVAAATTGPTGLTEAPPPIRIWQDPMTRCQFLIFEDQARQPVAVHPRLDARGRQVCRRASGLRGDIEFPMDVAR